MVIRRRLRDEARPEVDRRSLTDYDLTLSFNAAKRACNRVCERGRLEGDQRSEVADGSPSALSSSRPSATLSLGISPVEEAAMDRLKLETAYLRALDVLMSAVDE